MAATTHRLIALGLVLTVLRLPGDVGGEEPRVAPPDRTEPAIAPTAPSTPPVQALTMLAQVVFTLEKNVRTKQLNALHTEDVIISAVLGELLVADTIVPPARAGEFKAALTALAQRVGALHLTGDLCWPGQQADAEAEIVRVVAAFATVQSFFSPEAQTAARKSLENFTCVLHRQVVGRAGNRCPTCSATLDQLVRVLPTQSRKAEAGRRRIRASVHLTAPLVTGQSAPAILRLEKSNGTPVLATDLIETHTRQIHLLMVDPGLTDYHHEHPTPTLVPGEYAFNFTPNTSGSYRVWADVRLQPLGFQEYAMADIAGSSVGGSLTDRQVRLEATVESLRYSLSFAERRIKVGVPVEAKLRVTSPDGTPFEKLEPLMGSFAHIVGFSEDYRTVVHLHANGTATMDEAARGGPDLVFQFYSLKPGFVRLFVQVQVGGVSRMVPFGIRVDP